METVYIAYNFSRFAIYLPKLIKNSLNFDKVLTETKMHSFLRYDVERQCNSLGGVCALLSELIVVFSQPQHSLHDATNQPLNPLTSAVDSHQTRKPALKNPEDLHTLQRTVVRGGPRNRTTFKNNWVMKTSFSTSFTAIFVKSTIASCFVHRSDDSTRDNQLKLYKCHCTVDVTKHYFANRIVNVEQSSRHCCHGS